MIQDIAPHIFNNAYKPVLPDENSFFLLLDGRNIVIGKKDAELSFPRLKDLRESVEEIKQSATYYFSIDDISFFGLLFPEKIPVGFEAKDINICREGSPQHMAFAGVTGFGLASWYKNHRFCGRCAKTMEHHPTERMMKCPACGVMEYPKISPAIIVGVYNGNKLLMTKYANRPYTNYALIAGFTEIGESIEETVRREVLEEVGVKIKNIRYYKSQPWSFTDCLLMGFFAELDGDDTITMDKEELALAEWIERDRIEPGNASLSLTGEMIEYFRNGNL